MRVAARLGVVALVACAVTGGCGKKQPDTAEEAVKGFVAAIQAKDYKTAADLVAWDTMARASNPDWGSFSKGDQKLIIGKLKEQAGPTFDALGGQLQGAQVGQAMQTAAGTAVAVTTQAGQQALSVVHTDKGWKVILPGGV